MNIKKIAALLSLAIAISGLLATINPFVQNSFAYNLYPQNQPLHFDPNSKKISNGFTNESGVFMPLTPSKDGCNSQASGYVLPNLQGSQAWCPAANGTRWVSSYAKTGGGAVGWQALGISESIAKSAGSNTADNTARKEALYNFLYNKNTATSGSNLAWEQMGTALITYQLLDTDPKSNRGDDKKIINPSSTLWADLKKRLVDNPNITMTLNESHPIFEFNGNTTTDADGDTVYLTDKINTAGVTRGYSGPYDALPLTYGQYSRSSSTAYVWEFRDTAKNNQLVYALVLDCANPIGGLPGLPTLPDKYSLTPTLTTPTTTPLGTTPDNGSSASREDEITATARVVNNGVAAPGKNWYITRLTYDVGKNPSAPQARDSNNTGALCDEFNDNGCSWEHLPTKDFGANGSDSGSMPVFTVPTTALEGTKFCFVVSVRNPTEVADSPAWRHSAVNCVEVQKEYSLTPTIDNVLNNRPDNSVVEPGTSGTIRHSVAKSGVDNSVSVDWRLTYFIYLPGSPIPSAAQKQAQSSSTQVPCEAFPGTGLPAQRSVCTNNNPPGGWVSAPRKVFTGNSPTLEEIQYKVPDDTAVGTKLCWVASVSPPTESSPTTSWRHSAMHCLIVSKQPKIQVWGGDVRSGSKIRTSTSLIDGSTFGSWVEYAALSMGVNSGFSSGSGLGGGNNQGKVSSWHKLTFANTSKITGCTFGCYDFTLIGSTVTSQFSGGTTFSYNPSSGFDVNTLGSNTYRAGNIKLSGTTIGGGKTIILISTGTVTIEGDISYEDKVYNDPSEIPQLIIHAPFINIENSAGKVDAWLLAVANNEKGTLNTCSTVYDAQNKLSANRCNNKLTINGPVVADIVKLRRTAGSGVGTDELRAEPAEVFNLRADAFLWANARSGAYGTSQIQTVYTKELSPRF